MSLDAPLAAVSLTWREAPGSARSGAAAPMEDAVRRSLRKQGVRGVVEVHTCARSLWILSAAQPAWGGALWQSHVAARLPRGLLPAVHHGEDAFRHVLRVAVGLDSYVQGEADIGGQVLRAFGDAREGGRADVVLNQLGQSVAHLVAEGREQGFIRPNRGLGLLAVETLARLGADPARPVGVVGVGDIGRRALASLRRAGRPALAYNRTARPDVLPLDAVARGGHEALIVCTAGPAGWFHPPGGVRLVVDLGVPGQVHGGSGRVVAIDELLRGDPRALSSERLARSEAAVERELVAVLQRVRSVQLRRGLSAITALRDQFLADDLEPSLEAALDGLPPEQRRRVLRAAQGAIRQYNHRVLALLRDEPTLTEE